MMEQWNDGTMEQWKDGWENGIMGNTTLPSAIQQTAFVIFRFPE
ncbi:MAG: hypothetical protein AB9834_17605 [Lentimicrobium sp.]